MRDREMGRRLGDNLSPDSADPISVFEPPRDVPSSVAAGRGGGQVRAPAMDLSSGPPSPVKYDAYKPRFDLIPVYPLEELARAYEIGAAKYGDRNWEAGMRWGRYFRALMSHAWAWWRGETFDPEGGQHHLAAVVFCAFALIEYQRRGIGEDDRPPPYPPTVPDSARQCPTTARRQP